VRLRRARRRERLAPAGVLSGEQPKETAMSQAKRKHKGDLQRDDRGKGHAPEKSKKDKDKELDRALKDSFPSSDPASSSQPTNPEPAGDPRVKP
jgi:hypothetical protein